MAQPSLSWEHTATEELPGHGKKGKVRVGLVGGGDSDRRLQPLSPGRAVSADGAPVPSCPSSSEKQGAEHRTGAGKGAQATAQGAEQETQADMEELHFPAISQLWSSENREEIKALNMTD